MNRFIILLRAVNVGTTKLRMAELRSLLESLGYANVSTYVQSGNAIIDTKDSARTVCEAINASLDKTYGYNVAVFAFEPSEFQSIIDANPFIGGAGIDETKLHVSILQTKPRQEQIDSLPGGLEPEAWEIIDKAVYLYCPNGYGQTKLTNALFERKLKTKATTRNWKTMRTLLELATA